MIFNRYKITIPFVAGTTGSTTTLSNVPNIIEPAKYLTIPINMQFTPVDFGESIENLVEQETEKSINPIVDGEQIKYKSNTNSGYNITFRFFDKDNNVFVNDYSAAGFDTPNDFTTNGFKKSYFRLYFYDTNEPQNRNLLFFEELDIFNTVQPIINVKKIYWFRNDELFKNTTQNRNVYMIGRFFNAKTGKVHEFMNLPVATISPITVNQYRVNSSWWSSPIKIINPRNNNGEYNFQPIGGIGGNSINSITLTEQIIL